MARDTEVISEKKTVISKITCDKCGKSFGYDDFIEWEESVSISRTGGYGSVFGDMTVIELDLCQTCFKDLCGKYIKTPDLDESGG